VAPVVKWPLNQHFEPIAAIISVHELFAIKGYKIDV
jgi:hypothetical protein